MTSRGPLTLAALASAAVPGLDPDTVEGVVPTGPGDPIEVAFISDREHRRWVIRCPKTPAASAHLERSAALLALLARRLTMPVPSVKGWVALPEGGRAAVHTYLTGRLVTFAGIEAGSTLAVGLGRTIAQLHNLDARVYEEAGVPVYDAASYRSRRLAELDRAAATGRVPTALLGRWERVLDDEKLWDFTTTATHGAIGEESVLATPDDGTGADADIKALLGWENAQVADPADDLAPIVAELPPEAVDTVLEAYAHARVERPDRHLRERASVIGEMQLVRAMMIAVAAGDDAGAEGYAAELRRLDDRLAREEAAREATTRAESASTATSEGSEPGASAAGPTDGADSASTTTSAPAASAQASTGAGRPPSRVDTQPVRTGPLAAAPAAQDGADAPAGDSATGDSGSAGDATGASTADDSEDAVQVEHPAEPTPVTSAATTTDASDPTGDEDPEDSATGTADEPVDTATGTTDTPEAAATGTADEHEAATDEHEAATGTTDGGDTPSGPRRGSDHVTAEVTPLIDDDDDDDVVPIRPR